MPESLQPADKDFSRRVQSSFDQQHAMKTIGARMTELTPGRVVIGFNYHKKLTQQHDFIHAGILSTVMDSACGYAAYSLMPTNAEVLTVEFKINLMSPAKGEYFYAVGEVVKAGRTISVANCTMFAKTGETAKPVATMTGTLMTIADRPEVNR